MRARTAGAFFLGLAIGMLCLGAVLWRTGRIQVPLLPPAPTASTATAPTPVPAPTAGEPNKMEPLKPPGPDLNALAAEAKNMPGPVAAAPPPHVEPPPGPGTAPLIFGPPAVEARPPVVAIPDSVAKAPSAPARSGEADRIAPAAPAGDLPHLAMPLNGIDPKKLADSFKDARDGRKHEALDIPAARGTPVLAVAEGNVAKLFTSKQGGITVYQFDNTSTFCYYYAHLDRYAPGLKEGTLLRKGDVLGYVGSTGNASAAVPHLHLAVFRLKPDKKWWDGTPIDPLPLLQ